MSKKTIYLEDAINALHTEIVKRRISEDVNDDGSLDEFDTEDILRKLPPADIQPVVRCRNCEHWDTTWQNDFAPNYHYCSLVDGTRRGDFYCADAERRR